MIQFETGERVSFPYDVRFAFDGPLGDVLRSYFAQDVEQAKLTAKFKFYYRLRPFIPLLLRHLLQRNWNRSKDVPDRWYIQTQFLSDWRAALKKFDGSKSNPACIHPWPDDKRLAITLTHDVETLDGARLVSQLASIEETFGLRSMWNFVPYKYKLDEGLIRDLKLRGHEVGIHGFNHDGRLFTSKRTFDYRTPFINQAAVRFGATGFRAPMVHRNLEWLQEIDVDFDASCFDIDPFQAMPGGVGGVWPFLVGKLVELPYTLPQDHTLLVVQGKTSPSVWIEKLMTIRQLAGMALLITHPDYLDSPMRLDIYRKFLDHVRSQSDAWHALPNQVATWWRQRDASGLDSSGQVTGPASARASVVQQQDLFADFLSSPG